MTEELTPEFDPNDFAIRLRPHMVDGKWNGDVDICIIKRFELRYIIFNFVPVRWESHVFVAFVYAFHTEH